MTIIACFFALTPWLSGCMSSLETRNPAQPLVGFADFHNHQFAYLGFGGLAVVVDILPSLKGLGFKPSQEEVHVLGP